MDNKQQFTAKKDLDNNFQQLEMVVSVFRHGARQALLQDTSGPLEEHGKAQVYNLGQILRQRYVIDNKLINENFDPKQVYLHSSPVKRCQESLKWLCAGMYPTKIKDELSEKIKLQGDVQDLPPLQINSNDTIIEEISNQNDQLIYKNSQVDFNLINHGEKVKIEKKEDRFYHYYKHCSIIVFCQSNIKSSPAYQQILHEMKDIYRFLAGHFNEQQFIKDQNIQFNIEIPQFKSLSRFLDFYACQKNQLDHQQIYSPQIQEQLRYMKSSIQDMIFQHRDIYKLCVSEHLINFSNILIKKFELQQMVSEKDLKMLLYSCHDRNLYLLMSALISKKSKEELGYQYFVPPFASQLFFKIYSTKQNNYKNQFQNSNETQNYDINKCFIEISLNDQQLQWKNFNRYQITLKQFIYQLVPQVSFNEDDYQYICKQSLQFQEKGQRFQQKQQIFNNDIMNENIKVKAK